METKPRQDIRSRGESPAAAVRHTKTAGEIKGRRETRPKSPLCSVTGPVRVASKSCDKVPQTLEIEPPYCLQRQQPPVS
jgi:hypothetical protein